MRYYILYIIAALMMCSCGEYQRAQKSNDYNYKFEYAKRAFEQKKYVQAATLLPRTAYRFSKARTKPKNPCTCSL